MIGDHQQLKPNPAVYELAVKYNLEVSLFERLIRNKIAYHQLKKQHRMRPQISSLLVPHIYKELEDHPSVYEYEDVKGKSFLHILHFDGILILFEWINQVYRRVCSSSIITKSNRPLLTRPAE